MDPRLARHLEDDDVERYALGGMSDEESAPFAEHLLICKPCRERVEHHDSYEVGMTRAARIARDQGVPPRSQYARPFWLGIAASVLVAGVFIVRWGVPEPEPQTVNLQAMRGLGAKAAANRPLLLQPDLTGLASYPSYRVEIVNETGKQIFEAAVGSGKTQVTAPPVSAGIYFVRIYTPAGEILREYALDTR